MNSSVSPVIRITLRAEICDHGSLARLFPGPPVSWPACFLAREISQTPYHARSRSSNSTRLFPACHRPRHRCCDLIDSVFVTSVARSLKRLLGYRLTSGCKADESVLASKVLPLLDSDHSNVRSKSSSLRRGSFDLPQCVERTIAPK